jgi:hypothetical protein
LDRHVAPTTARKLRLASEAEQAFAASAFVQKAALTA